MNLVTLDVVLLLSPRVRRLSVDCSNALADLMTARGGACFRLGDVLPGRRDGPCEPHVSLFMMAVTEPEVDGVAAAVSAAAEALSPVSAEAVEYRYNGEGAPEVFFARNDEFRRVQRAVIAVAEPLRRGRLRPFGPGGEPLADVVDDPDPVDAARVRQLRKYGFDDVSDATDDRFNPHVTLTWPRDEHFRVALDALPPVENFSGEQSEVALYGMAPNGTCTTRYGSWPLTGPACD